MLWWEKKLEEIESSNIRMSSNDDVIYALEVIDELIDQVRIGDPKHNDDCSCTHCH